MAFDFPATPTHGQEFTPTPGGPTYVYNTPRWVVRPPVTTWTDVSEKPATFPASPHGHLQAEVTNLVDDLALKAPLASPTFSGDPKSVTPATADNDTSIATTAYVKSNIALVSQFPEAPTDGLLYGRKFDLADSTSKWVTVIGGAAISVSPPTGPKIPGMLWYETDTGNTFLWFVDGDSQQWVQQNVQPAGITVTGGVGSTDWIDITGKPSTFPPSAHSHTTAEVSGLDTALADRVKGTVRLTVSSTAPTSPAVNDIWIDTT